MSTPTRAIDDLSDDERVAANIAFKACSDCLKDTFNITIAYDDRAERLVDAIATYIHESKTT